MDGGYRVLSVLTAIVASIATVILFPIAAFCFLAGAVIYWFTSDSDEIFGWGLYPSNRRHLRE